MPYHNNFSLFDFQGQRKYLNQEERKRFYDIANTQKRQDVRLFCLLLFFPGARISEIVNLLQTNIDFSNKSVVIQTLKRRRKDIFRQIPLPDFLLDDLKKHIERLDNQSSEIENSIWGFSTRSASRYIKSVMVEAKIEGMKSSALGLRHGFAVHAVTKVPITQVQKWLGHANLQTTAIYVNVCGIEERELAKKLWIT